MTSYTTAERRRRYLKNELHRVRESNLKRLYGITVADYEMMKAAQNDCCAMCGLHEDEIPEPAAKGRPRKDGTPNTPAMKLQVDHCHKSGALRKLLCSRCNRLLGVADDDVEILMLAVKYLEE